MTTSSQNATPTNCFSSLFRRLLCAGGLPTHPSTDTTSDHQTTTTHHHLFKTDPSFKLQSPSPTRTTIPAGVVARLMGLDSFPTSTPSSKVSLGTIMMRSRSAGSLDFLPNFQIKKQPHNSLHRRVTTSLSFREVVPTFLETSHNHDLGKLDHHALGRSQMGFTPKQESPKNNSKKGIRREREREREKKMMMNKKGQSMKVKNEEKEVSSVKLKYKRKKKVVDDGFPEEHKKKYKSRKRTYNHPLPKMVKHDTKAKKQSMMLKRRESEYSEEYCMEVLVNVCRLTMEEINGGTVWMDTKVDKIDIEEIISYEVGQEILQLLLNEVVDELCSSRSTLLPNEVSKFHLK